MLKKTIHLGSKEPSFLASFTKKDGFYSAFSAFADLNVNL
jgi:hypothetical protein